MIGKDAFQPGRSLLLHLLAAGLCAAAAAQTGAPQANPSSLGLVSQFPVRAGGPAFRFVLALDKDGNVSSVTVTPPGKGKRRQTLATCGEGTDTYDDLTRNLPDGSAILHHADLNFDGFEDLELTYIYIPHLGKRLDCIYLWEPKTERFAYSKELSEVATNLEPHPETKTLTTREDWQGGLWEETTYRWKNQKLELIEQNNLLGDWRNSTAAECGFIYTCNRLIKGKLTTTLEKPICKPEEMDDLPRCPATPSDEENNRPKNAPN